jgi:DNA polymerase-4
MNATVADRRAILHCDLDAFYASVEQRDHPEYRGKPVIVGGGPGDRGVVAAASYEARAFGVHSAMPLQTAGRLCPDGIFVPGDGQKYEEASDGVMALFAERTPLVEPISLDEAFLDVTATEHLFGGAENIARELKRDVREQLGLVLSVGVATNKLCAKIGSDLRKPDGLVIVPAGGEAAFLAPLELGRLWGVGPKTREVLEGWDLRTIGDLAAMDVSVLEARLGEHGRHIWERAHGIDEGVVVGDGATPKSVGHSHTFDRNTLDPATIESMLLALSEGVGRRLRGHQLRGRTITLQLRVAPFETRTRQRTLAEPTDDDLKIFGTARQLLRDALAEDRRNGRTSPVRLVGVTASGIEVGRQLGLFDHVRTNRLNAALDAVREKFGDKALDRASARLRERRRFSDRRTKKST